MLQPPVEFEKLGEPERHPILGEELSGLCCGDNQVYCAERWGGSGNDAIYCLTVYDTSGGLDIMNNSFSLLGRMRVKGMLSDCHPRLNAQTQRVFVPCRGSEYGVRIYRCVGRRLVEDGVLRCVDYVLSLAIDSSELLVVVPWHNRRSKYTKPIRLVDVTKDVVIRYLFGAVEVKSKPRLVSILRNTALVCYGDNTLVTIPIDRHTRGDVIPTPDGLRTVYSIDTDNHSSFLLTGSDSLYVFVLDVEGNLRRRIPTGIGGLRDCCVGQSQLWLGSIGHVDVMTTE